MTWKRLWPAIYSRFCLVCLILCCIGRTDVNAQSYKAINYRREQGFMATTGYGVFQDSKGYIWIGTENGLMRFNGREFKVYTGRDGLPDNEVFVMREDDKERLWLLPFTNSVSYIRHGKIFNAGNDSMLRELDLNDWQRSIYFTDGGGIVLYGRGLTFIDRYGRHRRMVNIPGNEKGLNNFVLLESAGRRLLLVDYYSRRLYRWNGNDFVPAGKLPAAIRGEVAADTAFLFDLSAVSLYHYAHNGDSISLSYLCHIPGIDAIHRFSQVSESELLITTNHGAYIFDLQAKRIKDSFLTNYKVGTGIKAKDGTFWFGTAGGGIYRFMPTAVKSLKIKRGQPAMLYIKGTPEGVVSTTEQGVYTEIKLNAKGEAGKEHSSVINTQCLYCHYYYVGRSKNGGWITCANGFALSDRLGQKPGKFLDFYFVKAVLEEPADRLLIATTYGIYRLDKERFEILDTFMFRLRTTSVAIINNVIYAGTLDGLFACTSNKTYTQVLKNTPLLRRHITALCTDSSGALWVANNNAELVGIRNNKIFTVVDLKRGLQCNRISCLKASGKWIWIGTDNGLFAVMQQPPYNIVRHMTYATGLNSNQVNCLDIYGKRVWIGTIKGINYFDEDDVLRERDSTQIIINTISNGDRSLRPVSGVLELRNEALSIDFDVVDFSGGTRPVFEYKLGDTGDWTSLENNHLYFPTLPYGTFALNIRAFSPNWSSGAFFRQQFHNPAPFYHNGLFLLLALLFIAVLAIAIGVLFIRRTLKRDRDKLAVQQNLLLLEQTALQGQMNPHFIFNCIAAIKQYYNSGNTEKADHFVDAFSVLIRQTFEMGTETFVMLDKELNYLSQYLNVEQARFNDSFRYEIVTETTRSPGRIPVPAMLLQPIVENAVRHGVRHLPDGEGMIRIAVAQCDSQIRITITDNGIGRQGSRALQQHFPRKITSSTVSEKRIRLLNTLFGEKVIMETTDVLNEYSAVAGTRILITYPINLNDLLKDESNYS